MSLYGVEFSQFNVGGDNVDGDIIVGLRDGLNTQFTFSGASGTGTALVNVITQTAHGFTVGQIVYFNGTQYALAKADTSSDAEVIGIVSGVIDVNNFDLLTSGYFDSLSGLVAGNVYFLSDLTAGLLTTTEPTTVGHISKPLVIAVSNTTGYFFNFRGKIVPAPTSIVIWNSVNSNTNMLTSNGYLVTGDVVLTLPTVSALYDYIRVTSPAGAFTIDQNAGQQITYGTDTTTVGISGSLTSSQVGNSIELLCTNANTDFVVLSSIGNFITA